MTEREGYVTIKVLFFAKAREFVGEKEVSIEVPTKIRGKELLDQISKKFQLDALQCNVILALNETLIDLNSELNLKNEDEVAVIPPLSGAHDVIPSNGNDVVQLYEEVVEADTGNEVPSHLIQINANLQEINRRITSFINRKRQQINVSNIQDFCVERCENSEDGTCARVSAILVRRKDSKSHLKVHRVENTVGPQTHEPCLLLRESPSTPSCPPGAEERIANAERYLNVSQTTSRDVFSRLKAIEDKILYLESISPEYFDFDREDRQKRKANKRIYSSSELELKMQQLEAKLQKKTCL